LNALPRRCEAHRTAKDVSSEQIGTALRRLAADLVAERRRVAVLERENRELRAQLEALKHEAGEAKEPSPAA